MEQLEGLGVRTPTGNASRTNATVNWNKNGRRFCCLKTLILTTFPYKELEIENDT